MYCKTRVVATKIIWPTKQKVFTFWSFTEKACQFNPQFRRFSIGKPEKAMVPHSSTLAWQIPWMEEPGRLQSMGSLGVRHDWSNLADSLSPSMTLTLSFKCVSHFAVSDATHPCCCCLFSRYPCQTLRPHGLQHTGILCPSLSPRVCANSCPLSQWCHPTISSSVVPFSSRLQFSQHQGLFQWVSPSHQVATVLEFQLQHQSFQWTFRTDFL